ncbi:1959_t:CDS:2 [Gigaspora margarita]|uniref:1959_t:CDS:1 n=1 Tax=Gigaspora margarita TaxID=4874 RepID=A0ABN7V1P6_GIGMA|nr:1959_t:CDS:2 [Gigaspora margarita]
MYEETNISNNGEIFQSNFEEDLIDFFNKTIADPIELFKLETLELTTEKNDILQEIKDILNYCPKW